jgi:cell division protein FtsI (penicillin-binding protein 3)/stage V sporulation protein D (sporulation-specific penicillin-binding protein)
VLLGVGLLAFAGVIGRAVQVQVVDASSLAARAANQYVSTVLVQPQRGTIYSADGKALALEQPAKDIYVDPAAVHEPHREAARLADLLGYTVPYTVRRPKPKALSKMPRRERRKVLAFVAKRDARARRAAASRRAELARLTSALTARKTSFAYIAQQLPYARANRILSAHLPGIHALLSNRRLYPYGTLAAQLIGFTNIDGSGGGGLEDLLNRYLAGRQGRQEIISSPADQSLDTLTLRQVRRGRNAHLTIDSNIQAEVQTVLAETQRKWHARSATAIVMDPRTGAVLAMASAPTFNPNGVHDLSTSAFDRLTPNLATNMVYDPGSVFKVVTFSAALTNHIITPDEVFRNLPYQIQLGGRTIHDDAWRPPITYTAAQILRYSSNIGTIKIAQMVGPSLLEHWIYRYGFGAPSALRYPGESNGIVLPLKSWSGSSIGNIPIGQGVSVTPIQMASAYQAIANGGVMAEPHVVQSVQGVRARKLWSRRILPQGIDRELVKMLEGVVDLGTGTHAQIPGYVVAGKTGTAQKIDPKTGTYSNSDYVASFIGFLPAMHPRVEIEVVVDTPHGSIFGGSVAAPAFEQIGTWLTAYLGIPPSR